MAYQIGDAQKNLQGSSFEHSYKIGNAQKNYSEDSLNPSTSSIPIVPKQTGETDGFSFGEMIENIPSSAMETVKGVGTAVAHPVETIKSIGQIGAGAIQSIPVLKDVFTKRAEETGKTELLDKNRQAFNNVKDFFLNRYGSPQKALESLEDDPVGVALDVYSLLSGASSLIKSPKLTRITRLTEPITATSKVVSKITKPTTKGLATLGRESLGVTTGAGGQTLKTAYLSGKNVASKFIEALRGNISPDDVLVAAKEGMNAIKSQRASSIEML
jgi:hypothetical protein